MNLPMQFWMAAATLQGPGQAAEGAGSAGEGEAEGGSVLPEIPDVEEMAEWVEKIQDFAITHGPGVIGGLLVLIIGRWVAKATANLIKKVMIGRKIDPTLAGFTHSMSYMALMTLVCISAVETMGFETTSFVAVLGAATLAIGFALQGSLGNFASGVMLILFRPFKAGDFIEAAGEAGVVEEITVFATKMRTGDNKEMIVPNSAITSGTITNYSAKATRRIDCVFGIGYGDDIKKAKELLHKIVKDDKRILDDPGVTIGVSELGDSSVNFVCRPWVKTADYWDVYFDLHETVKLEFDKAGISIPFPQQDVHMHQVA